MPGARNRITRVCALLLIALAIPFCGKNIVFQHADPESGVGVHYDRAVVQGRGYVSLGNIVVVRRKFGVGFFLWPVFPFGLTWGHADANRRGLSAGAGKQSFANEILVSLNSQLLVRARDMGATDVINVRYTHHEYPVLLPIFGPLTRSSFQVSGEAVRLDPVNERNRRGTNTRPTPAPVNIDPTPAAPTPSPTPPAAAPAAPDTPRPEQISPAEDPGLFFDLGPAEPEPSPGQPPPVFDPEQQFHEPGEDAYPGFDPGA